MVRAVAALAVAAAVLLVVFSGRDGGAEAQACFGLEPFDFDTLEAFDNAGLYLAAIELAAAGEAVTSATTPSGEAHGLEYPGLLTGSPEDRVDQEPDTAVRIPPTLLKSIVWVESEFAHAHGDVPWGGVGRVQRSFDCGFGLGQITTGMENHTGNPTAKQALVGTHFLFNIAEAAAMVADKWNAAFLPLAGTGDPAVLEDWYYAVWAYNGLAYVNHPQYHAGYEAVWLDWTGHSQNPFLDPLRGDVWHCNDKSAPTWFDSGDGVTPLYGYGDYTYPERVYGCMRHPPEYPERLYDDPEYAPTPWPTATPEPEASETPTPETEAAPEDTPEGEATPTPDTAEDEATATPEPQEDTSEDEATPAPTPTPHPWPERGADGVARLWPPVQVNMPDLTIPEVASALSPQVYIMCAAAFWFDACQEMHFPTSFRDRGIAPHRDPTPPVDTSLLAALLGAPEARITGPDEVSIAIDEDGTRGSVEVLVQNIGTWIAPYRIQTSAPWILVERINRSGRLHGGVAVGAETTVVICTARFCGEDVTKRGHVVALRITLDPEELPEGEDVRGVVVIEPLFGEGKAKTVVVHAGPSVETTVESESESDEDDEDGDEDGPDQPLKHRIVVPNLAKDD